jgi:hypothetical protein
MHRFALTGGTVAAALLALLHALALTRLTANHNQTRLHV